MREWNRFSRMVWAWNLLLVCQRCWGWVFAWEFHYLVLGWEVFHKQPAMAVAWTIEDVHQAWKCRSWFMSRAELQSDLLSHITLQMFCYAKIIARFVSNFKNKRTAHCLQLFSGTFDKTKTRNLNLRCCCRSTPVGWLTFTRGRQWLAARLPIFK